MQAMPTAQRISVVVLTWNRADELAATLGRLLALPESPPIFVADNGSDDNTVALVKARFPTVCVVACGENRGAAGRNLAAACVATDYVAFCDDDTWWEPGALARAVQVLDAWPKVGVLSARVVVGDAAAADPTCLAMRASPLGSDGLPGPALVGYMAGACVFRTALFRRVGGYEPRLFIGGEEELVALDVLADGHAIVYCEQLTVHHHPSAQRDSSLRRRMLARNAAWVGWLRLPWPEACRATLRALATFAREGRLLRDGIALLGGLAWILPRRRVVPPSLVALRRRVAQAERRHAAPAPAAAVARAKAAAEAEAATRQPAGKVDVSS
ncbi:glycosyltransferase family 2 protein [Burkholderia glumae]|uniref:Glycosyltransferase n=1 Tax=Burkholderia glumae TaxID=337 RepID=A0AAQ0BV14_BURGL|nr:glycosyltransferase [Burkholderia glumae]ACR28652.1 Glycosyl transferase, family 2 [Burkholderia glumae BGR1]AJY64905.1 glycosyl transferase 2 family protein [Burkholderia glumae LMG 2196 = ATCC 33617]KHJ61313.1 glycosyl transferase family 2 [Burkholderia glumae]MCM2538392.1 glycosyltransferase [Burkholderia glumae]MCM2547984.1 glycosyltransferase [Burkholderia glumae]